MNNATKKENKRSEKRIKGQKDKKNTSVLSNPEAILAHDVRKEIGDTKTEGKATEQNCGVGKRELSH